MRSWLVFPAIAALVGCGGGVRRFPLRDPLWKDGDTRSIAFGCHPDPKKPEHRICTPEEYESSFTWDGADNLLFRPLSRAFAVDPPGESVNVNAFDEVPDSSWFTNRLGLHAMTPEQVYKGYCGEGKHTLDPEHDADGSWLIDQGKPNGFNPGFRINVKGVKYMLKADPTEQPERATGATSIATRLYYAAGWWAPCDSVVYVKPSLLTLKPGLTVTDNSGIARPFDQKTLDKILAGASHRGELVRMVASRWLPGPTLGPFTYEGTKEDDPNDVVPHEDRRDLRGAKIIAAWTNHFDSREQNSMMTWQADDPKNDASPGHVRHWYIDLGDCFGSEWAWDGISRRLGFAYYLDVPYVAEDFVTFGLVQRPWDRAKRDPDGDIFGYFHSRDFDPEMWRGGYPNPAFNRMSEADAAWGARTIAKFTLPLLEAAVHAGEYTDPRHTNFLVAHLLIRQEIILKRYFRNLSPIADLAVERGELCGVDLARKTSTYPVDAFRYGATMISGESLDRTRSLDVHPVADDGRVCTPLPHVATDGGARDDDPSRYVVVELKNGASREPLRAHLYDLGPQRGYKLVGIERI